MQCVTFVNQARILTGGRPLDRGYSNTNSKVSVREALIRQKAFTSERESIRSFMVISTLKQFGWYQKGLWKLPSEDLYWVVFYRI